MDINQCDEKTNGQDETTMNSQPAHKNGHEQPVEEAAAFLPDDLSAIPVPTEQQEMHPAWLKAQEALRSIGGTGQQQQVDTGSDTVQQQQSYEAAAAMYGWPPNLGSSSYNSYYQQPHMIYQQQQYQQHYHTQQQRQYRPRMMAPGGGRPTTSSSSGAASTNNRPVPLSQVSVPGLQQSASPRFTKPIRFPSAQQQPPSEEATQSQKFLGDAAGSRQYPVSLRSYIERAYRACEAAEEREKLESYLRQRVEPLLKSGAIYAVNWAKEPLPHELHFQLKTGWIPANLVKQQFQQKLTEKESGGFISTASPNGSVGVGTKSATTTPERWGERGGVKSPSSSVASAQRWSLLSNNTSLCPSNGVGGQPFSPGSPPTKRSKSSLFVDDRFVGGGVHQQQQQLNDSWSSSSSKEQRPGGSSAMFSMSPLSSTSSSAVLQKNSDSVRWEWTPVAGVRQRQQSADRYQTATTKSPSYSPPHQKSTLSKKERKRLKKQQQKLQKQHQLDTSNASAGPFPSFTPLSGGGAMASIGAAPFQKPVPHWQIDVPNERKLERARRFADDEQRTQRGRPPVPTNRRLPFNKFSADAMQSMFSGAELGVVEPNFASLNIVGTCTDIEKSFFRLTASPDPSQVRPQNVLALSLEHVKEKYKRNAGYRYASDQLKSIRQDLMIQNIRNDFTVSVYETNARIALENRDREEFNQCQNQLKQLYKMVSGGCPNRWEFTSYRLLYYIYMRETLDVAYLLDELVPDAIADECMGFALMVWDSWSMNNYIKLFRLYSKAPKMTGYVMDMFIDRERNEFLITVLKAFRPDVPVAVLLGWLQFSSEKALTDFLTQRGIEMDAGGTLDCRKYANHKL